MEFDSQHRWAAGVVFWRPLGIDSPSFSQTTPTQPHQGSASPVPGTRPVRNASESQKRGKVCSWWLILLYGRPGKSQISRRMKVDLNSGVKSHRHFYINHGGTEDTEFFYSAFSNGVWPFLGHTPQRKGPLPSSLCPPCLCYCTLRAVVKFFLLNYHTSLQGHGRFLRHHSGRIIVPVDNSPPHWSFFLALTGQQPDLKDIRNSLAHHE